jgi:hypothetical protein
MSTDMAIVRIKNEDIEFKFHKIRIEDAEVRQGDEVTNIVDYITDYIAKSEDDVKVWIGTDSQKTRKRNLVTYATVICLYKVGKGAHIVYAKQKRTDIKDKLTRLWWEVEYSMSIANYLKDNGLLMSRKLIAIHLDLSSNIKYESNKLYDSAIGYVKGMGYSWQAKPDAAVASYAADMLCH